MLYCRLLPLGGSEKRHHYQRENCTAQSATDGHDVPPAHHKVIPRCPSILIHGNPTSPTQNENFTANCNCRGFSIVLGVPKLVLAAGGTAKVAGTTTPGGGVKAGHAACPAWACRDGASPNRCGTAPQNMGEPYT